MVFTRAHRCLRPWLLLAAGVNLVACTPSLDWREARTEDGQLSAQFPCRPERHERAVKLEGFETPMHMMVCKADGVSFALTSTTLGDPARVTPVINALRSAAAANLRAVEPQVLPWQLVGMTPNPQSARLSMKGQLPDGTAAQEEAAFFVRGLRVYQATMLGAAWAPAVTEEFFGGLRFMP